MKISALDLIKQNDHINRNNLIIAISILGFLVECKKANTNLDYYLEKAEEFIESNPNWRYSEIDI